MGHTAIVTTKLDADTFARLTALAQRHGRTLDDEVLAILSDVASTVSVEAVAANPTRQLGWAARSLPVFRLRLRIPGWRNSGSTGRHLAGPRLFEMIVLDTNVISAVTAEVTDPAIVRWLDQQRAAEVTTTTVTIFELWLGVDLLPAGRRRDELAWRTEKMLSILLGQLPLTLSEQAARLSASLQGERKHRGIVVDHRDAMIAGICLAHGATLATRNIRHFADTGVTLVDPWAQAADT